jgi:glutamate N-acetyltransferase/amino-acid N-acetyltransferase
MSLENLTGKLPRGFAWGAVKAGIKASGNLDLAVAVAPKGAAAAAMFTSNQMVAAPVEIDHEHLHASGGRVSVLLVNAGNANCATGLTGIGDCRETCTAAASQFGCLPREVFPSSTGIIGVPLPVQKVVDAMKPLHESLGAEAQHAESFARAIMTTDTRMKVARATIETDAGEVRLFGAAKGAGMIHPQLVPPHATMLVYLFTDLDASPAELQALLEPASERSFNSISIDGDTSTNDTVLLLASGESGVSLTEPVRIAFQNALNLVCQSLAHQIVDDGEGVTHVVELRILGAQTVDDARRVAKAIAHSPLCKTSWSSGDPNWGRLIAAAGYSGTPFEPGRVRISIGPHIVYEGGAVAFDRAAVHDSMLQREFSITMELGEGEAECRFLTCDLTAEYVRINADYST